MESILIWEVYPDKDVFGVKCFAPVEGHGWFNSTDLMNGLLGNYLG